MHLVATCVGIDGSSFFKVVKFSYLTLILIFSATSVGCERYAISNTLLAESLKPDLRIEMKNLIGKDDSAAFFVVVGGGGRSLVFEEGFQIMLETQTDKQQKNVAIENSQLVSCNWIRGGAEKKDFAIYEPSISGRELVNLGKEGGVVKITNIKGITGSVSLYLTRSVKREFPN